MATHGVHADTEGAAVLCGVHQTARQWMKTVTKHKAAATIELFFWPLNTMPYTMGWSRFLFYVPFLQGVLNWFLLMKTEAFIFIYKLPMIHTFALWDCIKNVYYAF